MWGRAAAVLVLSVVLGGATSFGQTVLPEQLASFANSASGWTLLTVLLVWWARVPWGVAAVLGAFSFVLLTVGYAIVSGFRGYPYDPLFFSAVGVVVGPFVGMAASVLRDRAVPAALATALLAGIGVGESIYGLTVVGDTTSPVYWTAIGALGILLLVFMLVHRLQGTAPRLLASAGAAIVATAFPAAYMLLGSL
jgi:hypothetical protein